MSKLNPDINYLPKELLGKRISYRRHSNPRKIITSFVKAVRKLPTNTGRITRLHLRNGEVIQLDLCEVWIGTKKHQKPKQSPFYPPRQQVLGGLK